jgi:hypothetical protein
VAGGPAGATAELHRNLVLEEAEKFLYTINSVALADGDLTIKFTVSNPIDMTPWDITAEDGPWDNTRATLRFRVAWATSDYSNDGSGENVGQPFTIDALAACPGVTCTGPDQTDGSFTIIQAVTVPTIKGDSIGIAMEGHPSVDVDEDAALESIPVQSRIAYVNVTPGEDATPRREIVDIMKCNNCHGVLSLHGENRTDNVQVCATCHNANATDIEDRGFFCIGGSDANSGCDPDVDCLALGCNGGTNDGLACDPEADCPLGACVLDVCVGGTNDGVACDPDVDCPLGTCGPGECGVLVCVGGGDQGEVCNPDVECVGGECTEFTGEATIDFKAMVHGIHAANILVTGRSLHDYTEVTYPRHLRLTNECNACHLEGTNYPVDVTEDFRWATTTESSDDADPTNDVNTTFNAATCGGCHLDFEEPAAVTEAHMVQNGSWFDATQNLVGSLDPDLVETCVVCHGPGKSQDVVEVHAAVGGE